MVELTRVKPATMESHLLAASPHMRDPNFARTVVLVLHHSADGAFGVVLNRPVGKSVKGLLDKVIKQPCPPELRIGLGGPLPSRMMAMHDDQSLREIEAMPGVYMTTRPMHLRQLLGQSQHQYRLFIGHAGWGPGQLEQELARGDWLTVAATIPQIFDQDVGGDLWRNVVRQIGRSLFLSLLKIKHVPKDPSLN